MRSTTTEAPTQNNSTNTSGLENLIKEPRGSTWASEFARGVDKRRVRATPREQQTRFGEIVSATLAALALFLLIT